MLIGHAAIVYYTKMGEKAHTVSDTNSRVLGKNIIILKDADNRRLACVVESKRAYTVDYVKKMHI